VVVGEPLVVQEDLVPDLVVLETQEHLVHQKVIMAERVPEAAEEPEPLEVMVKQVLVEMEELLLFNHLEVLQPMQVAEVAEATLLDPVEQEDLVAVAQEATDMKTELMLLEMGVVAEELVEITLIMPAAVMEVMD
jgi:hypothetical protein